MPHITELIINLAAAAGDPRPPTLGGPDTKELVEWDSRWGPVERALKIGNAAWRMADSIRAYGFPSHTEQARALAEFDHHCTVFEMGF